jgi:hypothetical protein
LRLRFPLSILKRGKGKEGSDIIYIENILVQQVSRQWLFHCRMRQTASTTATAELNEEGF